MSYKTHVKLLHSQVAKHVPWGIHAMMGSKIWKLVSTTSLFFAFGSSKTLSTQERWRDSAALLPTTAGPDKPYDVIERRTDSFKNLPFQLVVHNAIKRNGSACDPQFDKRCILAPNSPGRIGEMYYEFQNSVEDVRGHSSQIMISCRCLDYNCRYAIVMQSRLIKNSPKVTCFYPRVQGKWLDCHTEILRTAQRDKDDLPEDVKFAAPYRVVQDNDVYWEVKGKRRANTLEEEANLQLYERINFTKLVENFETALSRGSTGDFFTFGNETMGDDISLDSFLLDDNSEKCAKMYAYARRSADQLSAQQDRYAVGVDKSSYVTPRPDKVSPTDAFLAVGTAFAGLFTAIGIWSSLQSNLYESKREQKEHIKWYMICAEIVMLVTVTAAELGVLAYAFTAHHMERNWRTFFMRFDASLTLPPEVAQCKSELYRTFSCSAMGGIYMSVATLGTAGYYHPTMGRWWSALIMFILISSSVLIIFLNVIFKLTRFIRARRNDPRFNPDISLDTKAQTIRTESRSEGM